MNWKRFPIIFLLIALPAAAQTTANLTGTVTTEGTPIPGVTVTVTSPNLQGSRTVITDVNGNYNFTSLPPGDYSVKFDMEGMQPVTRTVRVTLSQTTRADASLELATVSESMIVTAAAPTVRRVFFELRKSKSTNSPSVFLSGAVE